MSRIFLGLIMLCRISLVIFCLCLLTLNVLGDTLKLNDGTIIQGRVIDQGDKYWVKDAEGQSHFIDKTSVVSFSSDDVAPAAPATPSSLNTASSASSSFATVKYKADRSPAAIAAVALWQSFIDSKPSAVDLVPAKAQLKHWQEVLNGRGEKINGKWVWGDAHEKLIKHARELTAEGQEALRSDQTLVGISKLEEAVKIYPNNFEANFELGYFNLLKGVEAGRNNAKIETGIQSLETAVELQPDCAAALSDLAIGYNFKRKYQLSVQTAYKAAKLEDSKEIVQNLIDSIADGPPGLQNNSNIKPIMQEAMILAGKYGIQQTPSDWVWVRPDPQAMKAARLQDPEDDDGKTGPPGLFANGTGFFISPDGYILTNRHVAKPGDYLMVRLSDNTVKLAERIIIDDQQDMAVIKIKVSSPVPFVRLAAYDHPAVGADVAVFGFPLLDRFGLDSSVKMTRGIVTAWDKDNELCDVTVDAIVNPGNSGGPMVDHHGNLLALTAMKTVATDGTVSTYGLGYSTARIREFLTRQQEKLVAAKLESGNDDGQVLSNEELATQLTPATVCILDCRGTPPTIATNGEAQVPDVAGSSDK